MAGCWVGVGGEGGGGGLGRGMHLPGQLTASQSVKDCWPGGQPVSSTGEGHASVPVDLSFISQKSLTEEEKNQIHFLCHNKTSLLYPPPPKKKEKKKGQEGSEI